MKTGIICAMQGEIELLLQDLQDCAVTEIGKQHFYSGSLYGKEVVLALSGIGKVAAACTCVLLSERFSAKRIVFSGMAGGIAKGIEIGDVVVGDKSCQHDFNIPGRQMFYLPEMGKAYFDSDPILREKAVKAADFYFQNELRSELSKETLDLFSITSPKVHVGTIATGDQFICDENKKHWLSENVENLQCVEMEGAAVSQVCDLFRIPHVLIRVISDSANQNTIVDFDAFAGRAARYFVRGVVRNLLKSLD